MVKICEKAKFWKFWKFWKKWKFAPTRDPTRDPTHDPTWGLTSN